ncbi:MAG: restriction endonuclease subunit S [Dokdonella sp.]|uniref:restriction endonuclease subunit S n=1 Tax=Dokdonella sp. TaxID=2291710 RepID=UPI0025C423AD|nr:restriction endonuclease subunit S [Dokdonella sp.]MBZ0223052.1 restriction endonuclease subunit S [Dokdonella sp.]
MVNDWTSRPLRDCATWYSGGTPRKGNSEYWNGSIPWISAKSLTDFFVHDSEDRVTEAGAENGTRLVPKNAILFIVRGMSLKSEFRMGITTRPVTFNQDLKALIALDGVLPKFLAYAIKGRTQEILSLVGEAGHGTGVLPTDRIQSLKILLPPEEEQLAIAHILGTLDDKIELNRKQNETLEAMARALFKAWFVDFEPVRAKLEGRWQRGQSLPGLPAQLYDLFPDRLVESELGEMPEGWEMRSLDSIANYLNGLALQKFAPESETEFLPVIKIAQLRAGNTVGADKASTQIKPEYVVVDGDVLFSWSGSLEVEVWNGGRGALNQHLFKVTSDEVPKWFYFFATRHHLSDFRAIAAGKATTMGHIQRKHLTEARIAVAPPESMEKFDAVIASQFDQLVSNAQQSRSLAQLRDTLLPKLISGELRIPDAERVVGATA